MSQCVCLWDTATIYTTNLIKSGLISATANDAISVAAKTTFEAFCSSSSSTIRSADSDDPFPSKASKRRSRRKRPSDTGKTLLPGSSLPTENNSMMREMSSKGLTLNDYFFEHQRNNGYIHGTPILSNSEELKDLSIVLLSESENYLKLLNNSKKKDAAPVINEILSLMASGVVSIDMWAAIQSGEGAYHRDHVHEEVLLSGVYYASIPYGSAPLEFHNPRTSHSQNTKNPISHDENNQHYIYPKVGQLVIFPPWLLHGVPKRHKDTKQQKDDARISFAFNLSGGFLGEPWSVTRI